MSETQTATYEPGAGESLYRTADKMVALHHSTHKQVLATFNGIVLSADKGSTPEDIALYYHQETDRKRKEYEASPEGKEAKLKAALDREILQRKADNLMSQLPSLNFTDLSAVLTWLCDIEEPRDRIGVTVDVSRLIQTFRDHGFERDANCDEAFDENDRENYARWIIGQSIKEPHYPGTVMFTERWREKFKA